jgi:hypothetical protein
MLRRLFAVVGLTAASLALTVPGAAPASAAPCEDGTAWTVVHQLIQACEAGH